MKIYITRHSKTIRNNELRLQGRGDSPLTNDGILNALALKKYLNDSNLDFDYIYSSPIKRSYHTACLLFDESRIIKDNRLMEMDFGDLEGKKIHELKDNEKIIYDDLWNHPERFDRIPHGESYDEVIERCQSFLDDIEHLSKNSTVLIITHGMFFIVLLATMLHLDKKDYVKINHPVVDGCSLTFVEFDDDYHLKYYNKHDYLPHKMEDIYN